MRRHLTAQPAATYREALSLRNPAATALPRTYIRCTRTPFPPPVQPGTPGWDCAELDAGHWPMITVPRQTATLLDQAAT